ncbi:Cof-type HAD-IIB family hydrolase [Bacteroidaceae bacterium HV4-6-C5C]|jgi:Cof subfamily protein (haloacid dehalogenase superfamily)|nr:Cof-type HAD-IIB family hydrolase [Bacteroidaceae bacterium HV4-6-C5C]
MIKALFFDIDGTLVSFKTHEIPNSTIEAITAAKAKGIRIFIATGRPSVIINNLSALQERGLIDGYITMNGGYCYIGDNVIYKSTIPEADVRTIAEISARKGFPCIFVGEHDICVCQPDEMVRKIFVEHLRVGELPEKGFEEAISGKSIYQITPFITEEEEREILPLLSNCESGRWYPAFVDITAKGNTKQKGIDEIISQFGILLEETMAIGDGGNDIGMIRHAAIGVAMGNATDTVKQHADYVTSSVDEDGIANALKHFSII